MTHWRRPFGARSWLPSWAWRGLLIGLAVSLPVPLLILASQVRTELRFTYPLLLLPLLLAGPLAVHRRWGWRALVAALSAGLVSGTLTSAILALAMKLTGFAQWGLVSASSAAPMPALPRVGILPMDWLTWPLQDLLVFQPLLAVFLGALALASSSLAGRGLRLIDRLLPASLGGRLRWAFGMLTAMSLALGAVGFGMIEEMHYRIHRLELLSAWQDDVATIRAALDNELQSRLADGGGSGRSPAVTDDIAAILARLSSPTPRPGVSVSPDMLVATIERYRPFLDEVGAANAAYRASEGDIALLRMTSTALSGLKAALDDDLNELLQGTDRAHHERLILVMALVAAVAGVGLWTGERIVEAIASPLAALSGHVQQVARGDFSHRVSERGPRELRTLGNALNEMTADLARLYDEERERRASAERLASRERELTAAKELWTNTLVHDLKGPLTLIAGWSELLEESHRGRPDPLQEEAIRQLQQAARTLEELVADVNDSFRLESGALPVHRSLVEPRGLARSAVEHYRGPGRRPPLLRIADDLGPVHTDVRLIRRVLHNLIGNAYKYAGPTAQVAIVVEPTEGGVHVAVDDDGPGIPHADREHVFERFTQGRGAAGGAGLGLAFCRLVVEELGGRIWAETSPLGGTRISFRLPLAPAALPTMSPPAERAASSPRVA